MKKRVSEIKNGGFYLKIKNIFLSMYVFLCNFPIHNFLKNKSWLIYSIVLTFILKTLMRDVHQLFVSRFGEIYHQIYCSFQFTNRSNCKFHIFILWEVY